MTIQTRYRKAWKRQHAEIAAWWQESREVNREIQQQQAKTALLLQETDRQMQEDHRRIQETDRQIQENHRQMQEDNRELSKRMRETDRQIGALGNRFGELAEHLVAPNIIEKFNLLGYHFEEISPDKVIKYPNGESVEVDILLENDKYSVAVEVKAKPKETDVDQHITRLEFLRRHKDKHHDTRKLQGAIAGAIMVDSVRSYTLKAGFYVIEQTGDTVKIDAPKDFVPREW